MKMAHIAACAASVILLLAFAASAGTFHARTLPRSADPGSRERTYQVYIPDGFAPGEPLVTILHGCRQTERNMIAETRFTELADEHGFAVAFPFITSFDPQQFRFENCWGFWFPAERREGMGEVADLRRLIDTVEGEFDTDPARRYIAGLSSGAAMAVAVAVAYSEDIAAAGAVAGLPYAESSTAVTFACGIAPITNTVPQATAAMAAEQATPEERRLVPLMVIHSINDCTVPIVNGRNLRDSWIGYYGADPVPDLEEDCMAHGISCSRTRYADATGVPVVETVFYSGRPSRNTHYWPGDNPGQFADPRGGPSASDLLWAFFADKSLDAAPPADLRVTSVALEHDAAELAGVATADPPIAALAVRLDGNQPAPERPATLAASGDWTVRFEALTRDQFYTPVLTATLGDGRTLTRTGERFALGDPRDLVEEIGTWQQHLAAERIAMPGPACANRSFGVCDRDFTTLFFEHGFAPFPLYKASAGSDWFAIAANAGG